VIDFRYHLVSIVAVFLALAIGIVVGSTALKPAVITGLQKTSNQERKQIDGLITQNAGLKQQRNAAQAFAAANERRLLAGLLDGQRVVLVQAPGAPGQVTTGVSTALTNAGALVTGTLQVQQQFFSTGTQANLDTLNRQLTVAGTTTGTGTPQTVASQLIANAIMTKDQPGQPPVSGTDSVAKSVLSGYAAGGFLSISSGELTARATLAVVIIPATPPTTSNASQENQALVSLAQQLGLAGSGAALAGQLIGSGPGSAIDVLRSTQTSHVSSVDDADYTTGQIALAQALYEQLTTGKPGNYGTLSSASGAGPSPGPSPSPSASVSASTAGTPAGGKRPAGRQPTAGQSAVPAASASAGTP
jgi:copper transport outer membrane protein MctB